MSPADEDCFAALAMTPEADQRFRLLAAMTMPSVPRQELPDGHFMPGLSGSLNFLRKTRCHERQTLQQ